MKEFKLPIKTVSEANSGHEHWTSKHKRHKLQKRWLLTIKTDLALSCKQCYLSDPVDITLIRIAPRKLDDDNLQSSLKYIRDYIADILFPGQQAGRADDTDMIIWKYDQEKGNPKEYAIKIRID